MRVALSSQFVAVLILAAFGPTTLAQIGQLNGGGGNTQSNAGAGSITEGAASGGTTEGLGGVTTEGLDATSDGDRALAGSNQTEVFVGGNNSGGFVGSGGLENDFNSNRRFQNIANQEIARGSTRESSGTTRRMPVAFKVGFRFPKASGTSLLMGTNTSPITQIARLRPELRQVNLFINADGIAVLAGQAPDGAAARLAANLVRLRPGVKKVQNNIRVVQK